MRPRPSRAAASMPGRSGTPSSPSPRRARACGSSPWPRTSWPRIPSSSPTAPSRSATATLVRAVIDELATVAGLVAGQPGRGREAPLGGHGRRPRSDPRAPWSAPTSRSSRSAPRSRPSSSASPTGSTRSASSRSRSTCARCGLDAAGELRGGTPCACTAIDPRCLTPWLLPAAALLGWEAAAASGLVSTRFLPAPSAVARRRLAPRRLRRALDQHPGQLRPGRRRLPRRRRHRLRARPRQRPVRPVASG